MCVLSPRSFTLEQSLSVFSTQEMEEDDQAVHLLQHVNNIHPGQLVILVRHSQVPKYL